MRTRSGAGGNSPDADNDFSEEITDDGPPPLQSDVSDINPALEEQVLETNVDVVIDSSAFQASVDKEVARVLRQRENDAKVDAPYWTVDIALRADLPLRNQPHSRTLLPRANPPIVRMSSAYMSENIEQSSIKKSIQVVMRGEILANFLPTQSILIDTALLTTITLNNDAILMRGTKIILRARVLVGIITIILNNTAVRIITTPLIGLSKNVRAILDSPSLLRILMSMNLRKAIIDVRQNSGID